MTYQEVTELLADSTLFKDVNYGKARLIHLAAMKDKEQLLEMASKNGLPTILYSLYALGYRAGARDGHYQPDKTAI